MNGARGKKWRRLGVILLAAAGVVGAVAWMARAPEFSFLPVPHPNGYDTLLAAAQLVVGTPPAQGRFDQATDDEMRAYVAANSRALSETQRGLAMESVVPLARLDDSLASHIGEVGSLRHLSRVLVCRAVLARREGRTTDAMDAAVDVLRYAHATTHGGLLLDQMAGAAYRRQALAELGGPLLDQLTAADARRAIVALEQLEPTDESVAIVAHRDRNFSLGHEGMMMRLTYLFHSKTLDALAAPALRAAQSADDEGHAQARILLVRLGLHAYAKDHPQSPWPPDLAALVPAYLSAIPPTPDGRRPLILADLPTPSEAGRDESQTGQKDATPSPLQTPR